MGEGRVEGFWRFDPAIAPGGPVGGVPAAEGLETTAEGRAGCAFYSHSCRSDS